ncbi:signal peptidase I [Parabacteroides sp. 52]|uniref:signal peptidase I n=1 Tax=unclassified Parabacteroides TaxID=2649774 RepID=UPI0013D4143B|nr:MULTISPECIES: signal peptidase I [unclassified Parabacteroides]MDH6534372.1 signal peptidase I [Parabacteroides sp. PM5-20]NDV54870.1 signal peptidase I [Parabacteroides sp. 52]
MEGKPFIRSILKWLVAFLLAIVVIMTVRHCFVESFRISTGAMEGTMHPGDYILVNKWKNPKNPGRNRVVLFSSPLLQDSTTTPLLVSRCMGMPGDTIRVNEKGYTINGELLPFPPYALHTYLLPERYREGCFQALQALHIPLRELKKEEEGHTLQLTSFELYQVCEEMAISPASLTRYGPALNYSLTVPRKGQAYRLDETTLPLCKEAIYKETNGKAFIREGKLFLDGKETSFFFFQQDYYWMLSDNSREAVDSRHLGFIPSSHVIGNAWFCWYSNDRGRLFKYIP